MIIMKSSQLYFEVNIENASLCNASLCNAPLQSLESKHFAKNDFDQSEWKWDILRSIWRLVSIKCDILWIISIDCCIGWCQLVVSGFGYLQTTRRNIEKYWIYQQTLLIKGPNEKCLLRLARLLFFVCTRFRYSNHLLQYSHI